MKNDDGKPVWISGLFNVNGVAIAHIHKPLIEGIDRRK